MYVCVCMYSVMCVMMLSLLNTVRRITIVVRIFKYGVRSGKFWLSLSKRLHSGSLGMLFRDAVHCILLQLRHWGCFSRWFGVFELQVGRPLAVELDAAAAAACAAEKRKEGGVKWPREWAEAPGGRSSSPSSLFPTRRHFARRFWNQVFTWESEGLWNINVQFCLNFFMNVCYLDNQKKLSWSELTWNTVFEP